MSIWGVDNFDSDFAGDYLGEIVHKIIETIKDCLHKPDRDAYICGEARLMPGVDILVTLAKAYPREVISILEDEPVAEWRRQYLRIFDEQSDNWLDDEKPERRAVIDETFSKLQSIIQI
jgi:hypothetical protein